jgi:hypothetical protein
MKAHPSDEHHPRLPADHHPRFGFPLEEIYDVPGTGAM